MQFIPIDQITIPSNRQRREFDPNTLAELQASIEQVGLLHPLVVRQDKGVTTLVAGERRLRVLMDMTGLGMHYKWEGELLGAMVPCVELGELPPLEALQAEYDENVSRVDLTWPEKAKATAMLMQLRSAQAALEGREAPSSREIAEERYLASDLNDSYTQQIARMELAVSKYLDDPEIKGAGGLEPAFKILQRRATTERHAQMAAQVGPTFSRHSHTLLHTDALEWLTSTAAEQFACICTDPPYGIGADEYGDSGGMSNLPHGYDDGATSVQAMYEWLGPLLYRVAKPDSHLYMFCDIDWFAWLKAQFTQAGWKVFRTPLIWFKPQGMRAPWPQMGPQRKWEMILFAIKGNRPCNRLAGDVLTYGADDNLGSAAQKPLLLFTELLSRSCLPGDNVCDPFCGTGTILPAAHGLKLLATAVEKDAGQYGIALKRLAELR